MDTSSLDGAGGSYLDNSIERRCQDWEASEYYNSSDSCPCLDDPDAEGQVRRTELSTPETRDPLSQTTSSSFCFWRHLPGENEKKSF